MTTTQKHISQYTRWNRARLFRNMLRLCASALLVVMVFTSFAPLTSPITITILSPHHAMAQELTWRERSTTYFNILYTPGEEAAAEYYAQFVDTVFDDITTVFSYTPEVPITVRLYPSQESYTSVNPLAPELPGVIAHADFRHREVAVLLSATNQQSDADQQNNIRHELTHIVVAELSGNRLNTGFQEGIAQYVETHTSLLDTKMALLSQDYKHDTLLSWSSFDTREAVYNTPEQSYPQTLSVVAFLIETYGFGTFRDFLEISARSSGYRSALERAYGTSPDALETAWREWLPTYIDGTYRGSVISSYDLSHAQQLLGLGNYAAARQELEQAIVWLETQHTQQDDPAQAAAMQQVLDEARALLEQSKSGEYAEQQAQETRLALLQNDYQRAGDLLPRARQSYAALNDTRQTHVLQLYEERINRGNAAIQELAHAEFLARTLQYPQARRVATTAAAEFALLGDAPHYERAVALQESLQTYQHVIGISLLVLGFGGVIISLWGRIALHHLGDLSEMW